MPTESTRLPLLPLTDHVHFPRTDMALELVEPDYRELVQEVYLGEEEPWLGTVLVKPGGKGSAEIFPAGTAGRLVQVEPEPDGSYRALLRGEYRFVVEMEVRGGPYLEALVRPLEEPSLREEDPGIVVVKRDLLACTTSIASELGERFPLEPRQLDRLGGEADFEEVVNRLAAHLDLEPLKKLRLLADALPDRALHLLSILRRRLEVLDVLRPFRSTACDPERN